MVVIGSADSCAQRAVCSSEVVKDKYMEEHRNHRGTLQVGCMLALQCHFYQRCFLWKLIRRNRFEEKKMRWKIMGEAQESTWMIDSATSGSTLCKSSKSVMVFCWHLKQQPKQIMNGSETLRLNYSPAFCLEAAIFIWNSWKTIMIIKIQ